MKPERLSRKVQTASGGRHAPRSTCASATRRLAQHRFQLYSSRLLDWRGVTHEGHGFVFDDHCPSRQHQNLSDDAKTPRRATFTLGRNRCGRDTLLFSREKALLKLPHLDLPCRQWVRGRANIRRRGGSGEDGEALCRRGSPIVGRSILRIVHASGEARAAKIR